MDTSLLLKILSLCAVFCLVHTDPFLVWSQQDTSKWYARLLYKRGDLAGYWTKTHTYGFLNTNASDILLDALAADSHLNNTVFAHSRITGDIILVNLVNKTFGNRWMGVSTKINGLAIDWLNKNLYYSDPSLGVGLYSYKKEPYFALILKDRSFNGIGVDPIEGYLFVVDESGRRIIRSSLAGNSRSVIVSGLQRPTLLVADIQTKSLLWIDVGSQAVQKADYDGQNIQRIWSSYTIISKAFSGITVYEDYLLMAGRKRSSYVVRSKTNGTFVHEEKIVNVISPIQYGLTVVDTDIQQLKPVPCSTNDNGGCAHICTSGGTGRNRECLCQLGFTLGLDGTSCMWAPLMDNFLLAMDDHARQLYQIDLKTQSVHALQISAADDPEAGDVVYDPVDHYVYWTEWKLKQIRRLNLLTKKEEIFFILDATSGTQGVAVDVSGRNLYYSDNLSKIIGKISMRDKKQTTILQFSNNENPMRIQLDEAKGVMYFTDWGKNAKIEKANMNDGSQRQVLVSGNLIYPLGLALDLRAKHLYWIDYALYRLERVNTNGTGRQFILTTHCSPYSVALDQTHLYIACFKELTKVQKETWTLSQFGPKTFWRVYSVHLYSSRETVTMSSPTTPDHIQLSSTEEKTNPDDLNSGQTFTSPTTKSKIISKGGSNDDQTLAKIDNNMVLVIGVVVAGIIVLAVIVAVAVVMVVKTRNKRTMERRSQIESNDVVRGAVENAFGSQDRPDTTYATMGPPETEYETLSRPEGHFMTPQGKIGEHFHNNPAFRNSDYNESVN